MSNQPLQSGPVFNGSVNAEVMNTGVITGGRNAKTINENCTVVNGNQVQATGSTTRGHQAPPVNDQMQQFMFMNMMAQNPELMKMYMQQTQAQAQTQTQTSTNASQPYLLQASPAPSLSRGSSSGSGIYESASGSYTRSRQL
ncbi:hypothetical protein FA15DRAFT_672560 [Coprinopsis marcescibilis]|uniref:Uncharacterized protein n=1 Tax=Coprinopsis marcescibilis TaxID=230819 RepID=A0A5C3KN50_COPMA|nr:hypothetical protein FA15DRAFT_672560 [Coprinopsis marcescibilis]